VFEAITGLPAIRRPPAQAAAGQCGRRRRDIEESPPGHLVWRIWTWFVRRLDPAWRSATILRGTTARTLRWPPTRRRLRGTATCSPSRALRGGVRAVGGRPSMPSWTCTPRRRT